MNPSWAVVAFLVAAVTTSTCKDSSPDTASAEPVRDPTAAKATDRCEHNLPPTLCTQCNPALAAVFQAKGDWCTRHAFPKSFCPKCRPDAPIPDVGTVSAAGPDWCGEHGLPESKCTKCNPALIAKFKASGDWCAEHGFPESACPLCHPQQAPPGAAEAAVEGSVVRFRSPEMEQTAGIRTVEVERGLSGTAVTCPARLAFDADKVSDIRAIVPGIIRRIRIELGAKVEQGAPLFDLESTQIGEVQGVLMSAKERVRTASANLARKQLLMESNIASAREIEVAEQELKLAEAEARTAEATLRMAGAVKSSASGRYTLRAPMAGTVVRKTAVVGLLAAQSDSLAMIADTSVMWALCDIPEVDASRVALGQRVKVTPGDRPDVAIEGKITWIAAEVDLRTRTVTARAEVPNPEGRLRANQFAQVIVETDRPVSALSVPRSAVQRVGDLEVVFVRIAKGIYAPRIVQHRGGGENVQIEGRLKEGDAVVTFGAVLLRTEILPGSIGAGCCEVEPHGRD